MKTGGLSLEQAPQLSIPASFFLTIPIGVLVAGCIMLVAGISSLSSPWMPQALALAHAGTLGVLAMGMIGALYQMTPVIAGSAVPYTRFAHIVHALLLAGLAGFIWRLLGGDNGHDRSGPVLHHCIVGISVAAGLGFAAHQHQE